MSLHAQLSPEAQAKLAAQKRNSTISSIVIALLICTLLGIVLWIISLTPLFKNNEETVSYAASSDSDQEITKPEMTNEVQSKPSSPSSSMSKVIAANTPSPTAVPVPEITVSEPSLDFGDGDDFGDGWGAGSGDGAGGGGGFGIPASMQKRCSEADRRQRLAKEGGKPEFEDQVVASLRWLQKTQAKNGSWTAQKKPVAMTGLALLAYLGHCETPLSPEFGETVQNGIVYLVEVGQKNDGKLATTLTDKHWGYEHSIATYALAEAYTMCKEFKITIPNLEETVIKAGQFIMDNQHKTSGGWEYGYDTTAPRGGDTSISCWHVQALKACKLTKLFNSDIEKSAKKAIKYLEGARKGKTYTIGYVTNGKGNTNMTAGGALCFQQWGKGNRSLARGMIKWMSKNLTLNNYADANLYVHYYASQAMVNAQGRAWSDYNENVMLKVAAAQNEDGSWSPPKSGKNLQMKSNHYATCLATLMLEVYYRFLPSS